MIRSRFGWRCQVAIPNSIQLQHAGLQPRTQSSVTRAMTAVPCLGPGPRRRSLTTSPSTSSPRATSTAAPPVTTRSPTPNSAATAHRPALTAHPICRLAGSAEAIGPKEADRLPVPWTGLAVCRDGSGDSWRGPGALCDCAELGCLCWLACAVHCFAGLYVPTGQSPLVCAGFLHWAAGL